MNQQLRELYQTVREGLAQDKGPLLLPLTADRQQISELWETLKKLQKKKRIRHTRP